MRSSFDAVLFDLDGTLIDSAPDLAGAGNEMRVARGLPALPFQDFRPIVGTGARGMLAVALKVGPADPEFEALKDEFLLRYEQRITRDTAVFPGVANLLRSLNTVNVPCAIVTNKAARFALPLVDFMGLREQVASVICGDTTPHTKPHPAPLLEAAIRMGISPRRCVYVGDDLRDVQAGHAAGMITVAAAWGYLGNGEPIGAWGAHHVVESPESLLSLLAVA